MAAVNRGPGRYSTGIKYKRVTSLEGIQQRHDRRVSTMGRDEPQHGLHMVKPGSMNPRKVGR